MNYRAVMALGQLRRAHRGREGRRPANDLRPPAARAVADIREPSRKELAATCVLALSLDEASVKVSNGSADDAEEDLLRATWAGHLPAREAFGAPVRHRTTGTPPPDYLLGWTR